jgi:hypothetical protein
MRLMENEVQYPFGLKFGITFLDDAFGGIYPDDLVIMTAKTGAGKTEMATQLAYHNSLLKQKTVLLALEAYKGEIENRLLYRKLTELHFQKREKFNLPATHLSYQNWIYGDMHAPLNEFRAQAINQFETELENLHLYYRGANFDAEVFEAILAKVSEDAKLVICDHLHYFDLSSDDEFKDLRRTIRKIRDLTLLYRIPTVMVAHIRKLDKRFSSVVPDLEDIYGSSDISKVATKIFAAAPAHDVEMDERRPHIFPTYIRILKNRLEGARAHYTAICKFNIQQNRYEEEYCLGKIRPNGSFEEAKRPPEWAKHHRSITGGSNYGQKKAHYNPSDR